MIAYRGLAGSILYRNRIVLPAIGIYVVLFGLLIATVGPQNLPDLALALTMMFLAIGYLVMVGIFIHQDADVGTAGSAYPPYFFTLPVSTSSLVLLPMLLGSTAMFSTTFLLAVCARHAGIHIPLFWPAFLVTAILASLQAIFWFPFGIPYSKLFLTLATFPSLGLMVGVSATLGLPEWAICLELCSVISSAYGLAYFGLVRARRGDSKAISISRETRATTAEDFDWRRPFRSAPRAQSWYEWRQHGIVLPVMTLFLFLIFLVPIRWSNTWSPLSMLTPDQKGNWPTVPTFLVVYLPVLFVLVMLAAWVVGCGARRSDVKRGDRSFQLFFGTRPMSDGMLVARKLWVAAKSSAISWVLLLALCTATLFFLDAGYQNTAGDYVSRDHMPLPLVVGPYLTATVFSYIAAFALLLIAATWRNYVVGFWTELSGNIWLRAGYPLGSAVGLTIAGVYLSTHSPQEASSITFARICVLLFVLVAIKLIIAAALAITQFRSGDLRVANILRASALYLVFGGAIMSVALYITQTFRQAVVDNHVVSRFVADAFIVSLVILWTPMVRILLAPMMLARNRHQ